MSTGVTWKIFCLLLVVLLLAGCATLSREECQAGDWYGIGLVDGRAGKPASRMDRHNSACSQYGIRVDTRSYIEGRERGLIDYCRLENAFDSGLRGDRYKHVCPAAIDALFDRYNKAAYEVHSIKGEIESVDGQIRGKEHDLKKKDLSDEKRRKIRDDIRDLDRRHERLRDDLRTKERYMDLLMDQERHRDR